MIYTGIYWYINTEENNLKKKHFEFPFWRKNISYRKSMISIRIRIYLKFQIEMPHSQLSTIVNSADLIIMIMLSWKNAFLQLTVQKFP